MQQQEGVLKAEAVESLVHEERLKWQLEVAKVRRQLEAKLQEERRGWKEGREQQEAELAGMRKELEGGRGSAQQVGKIQAQLKTSQQRLVCG